MIERIEYQVAGRAYSGILFRAHSAVRGGVLVFHGGGGLTEHDRGVASRLADLGYIAFYALGAYLAGLMASPQFASVLESFVNEYPPVGAALTSFFGPEVAQQGIHLSLWLILPAAARDELERAALAIGATPAMLPWAASRRPRT